MTGKYLITDKGGKIYTVVTTEGVLSLSEIENPGEIRKALFETHGVDDRPPGHCFYRLQIRRFVLAGFAGLSAGAGSGCDGGAVSAGGSHGECGYDGFHHYWH